MSIILKKEGGKKERRGKAFRKGRNVVKKNEDEGEKRETVRKRERGGRERGSVLIPNY